MTNIFYLIGTDTINKVYLIRMTSRSQAVIIAESKGIVLHHDIEPIEMNKSFEEDVLEFGYKKSKLEELFFIGNQVIARLDIQYDEPETEWELEDFSETDFDKLRVVYEKVKKKLAV